jgi:DNA-binding CsgD family transcriptional regulator
MGEHLHAPAQTAAQAGITRGRVRNHLENNFGKKLKKSIVQIINMEQLIPAILYEANRD